MITKHHELINKLGERGFAGGDVATNPSRADDEFWPTGPSPIGVGELIDLIDREARRKPGTKQESHWAFLLGGAGNGKSFAARSLLNRLSPQTQRKRESNPAKRKYILKGIDCPVSVINDATIAAKSDYAENTRIALAEDILTWISQAKKGRSLAFACVNRGIVLEELNCLPKVDRKGLAFSEAVLQWLDDADKPVFANREAFPWILSTERSPADPWYRRVRLKISKTSFVVIHALSVDVGSLFEPRTSHPLNLVDEPPVPPEVSVSPDFRSAAGTRLDSVAGYLIRDLLSTSLNGLADLRPEVCPLRANLENLALENCRANWLTTLRGAEIASGRQTSYRDFWGLTALSLIGPRTVTNRRRIESGSVTDEVDSLLGSLATETMPERRLEILGRLATRRLHMALFRGDAAQLQDDVATEAPPDFPAARGLMLIDPAMDASQHCATVDAAMEHVSLGGKPSQHLLEHIPSLKVAWQPFDIAIEDAVIDVLNDNKTSDRVRRRLLCWFSGYLARALGCYVGGIGHEHVISAWFRCWHNAKALNPQFPTDLDIGLRTLLLPGVAFQANLEHQLSVPAFASRAVPFESPDAADGSLVLAMGVNHLRLRPVRKLDRLWVELISADSTVEAHSPLDFAILREALVCRASSYGFTEAGTQTAPRLERARASMMSTGSRVARRFGLVSGGTFRELAS